MQDFAVLHLSQHTLGLLQTHNDLLNGFIVCKVLQHGKQSEYKYPNLLMALGRPSFIQIYLKNYIITACLRRIARPQ